MADKKNILIFIESIHCGGAEKSLLSLLQTLDNDRYNVDLLLLHDRGLFMPYVPEQVNVMLMPSQTGVRRVLQRLGQLVYSARIRLPLLPKRHNAELRWSAEGWSLAPFTKKYDVAIAYQQGYPTYYVAEKVTAGKKLAWVNADLQAAGYDEKYNRRYYDSYDGIVAVSNNLRELLKDTGYLDPNRLSVVYDILNVDLIRELSKQQPSDIDTKRCDRIKIVTVGRMAHPKNYPLAVKTAAYLAEKGLDFEWIFVGDGTDLSTVRNMIIEMGLTDRVKALGSRINPYPYMLWSDIYVQTSLFEGYGLTIAEAKILGRPVVSTNFDVVRDQITDGQNGLLAEMTPESVGEKIMLMARDRELRNRIIANVKSENNTTSVTEIQKVYRLIEE